MAYIIQRAIGGSWRENVGRKEWSQSRARRRSCPREGGGIGGEGSEVREYRRGD
jgi:hypothetical protein